MAAVFVLGRCYGQHMPFRQANQAWRYPSLEMQDHFFEAVIAEGIFGISHHNYVDKVAAERNTSFNQKSLIFQMLEKYHLAG